MLSKEMSFEYCQGFGVPDGVGRSFHQQGTVNENVMESDFVPPYDGTTRCTDLRVLEGM